MIFYGNRFFIKICSKLTILVVVFLSLFTLAACGQTKPREEVVSCVSMINEAKEIKIVVEENPNHSNNIHIAVQKYGDSGQLIYMHNKMQHRETGEVSTNRLYQNGKEFDLLNKTYYEIVYTQNTSLGSIIPNIDLLKLESTTFEKIKKGEYLVTIDSQSLLGDMFGVLVFEYTITIKNNFISEIHFAGKKASISKNVGEPVIINEFEFTKRT